VAGEGFRFDPIGTDRFPLGEGPFRVRGLAYVAALAYVDKRLQGGRAALDQIFAGDPVRAYFDQIFVPPGSYDVSPLLRLHLAAAPREGKPIARFIEERSRASAVHDARGMWKPLFGAGTLPAMCQRLPLAFNRYFDPSQATVTAADPSHFSAELSRVPDCMSGMYVASTNGFVSAVLELAGAQNVRLEWTSPMREGNLSGIVTCRIRFVAYWD
jgi:hypothetical protein